MTKETKILSLVTSIVNKINALIDIHDSDNSAHSSLLNNKEDSSNKVTSISSSSTDVQYPSAKLIYDQLGLKQDNIEIINSKNNLDSNGFYLYTDDPISLEWDFDEPFTKYEKDNSNQPYVICKYNGELLPKDTIITWTIDDYNYDRSISDNTGKCKINMNVIPGTHLITASYSVNDFSKTISTTATVLPIIELEWTEDSKNIKNDSTYLEVIVKKNGTPITTSNYPVNFYIDETIYYYDRSINSDGTFRLNLNLNTGTYNITASYTDESLGSYINSRTASITTTLII